MEESRQREAELKRVRDEERAKAAKDAEEAKAKADAELQRERDEAKALAAKAAIVWPTPATSAVTGISKADLELAKGMSDEARILQLVEYLERAPIPEVGPDYQDLIYDMGFAVSDIANELRIAIKEDAR
jgi:hypothetical protein